MKFQYTVTDNSKSWSSVYPIDAMPTEMKKWYKEILKRRKKIVDRDKGQE
jgi:hypothetical protein